MNYDRKTKRKDTAWTMKNRLDIHTQHYFPFHIILLGFACIPLIFIPVHLVLSVGLSVVVILIFTTHYRLELDRGSNIYRDYLWIVGFRKGETLPLPDVEHVFVNRVQRESEYGLVARLSVRKVVHSGYVRLANSETLFIGESSQGRKLFKKAERIAGFFDVEIRKNY